MKIKYLFLALMFLAIGYNYAQETKEREKFDPTKDSFNDLKKAIEQAEVSNKRIILDVGGEWCIWCHRLDKFILENKEVDDLLHEKYIVVKVNMSPENKNEKFLAQFPKVKGYPHLFVLEKDGVLLHSQDTGLLEKEKSYDKEKLLSFLNEWRIKE